MKYILWDFDGTLSYRDGNWPATLHSVLLKNNIIDIPVEKITPYLRSFSEVKVFTWDIYEKSHKELLGAKTWWEYYEFHFSNIFQKLGVEENISIELSKQFKDEYMDIANWHIYDDVINVLEYLKKDNKNIILSNHIPELECIVRGLNIDEYFMNIFTSANIGFEKPNPKIYQYVLEKLGINETDCIIIGDSYRADIKGGLTMGIKSILVRAENTNNYEHYCKDLKNIIGKIEKM